MLSGVPEVIEEALVAVGAFRRVSFGTDVYVAS